MKGNEIMIGDWFLEKATYKPQLCKVLAIKPSNTWKRSPFLVDVYNTKNDCVHYVPPSYLMPVPLTAEILEKNGFVKLSGRIRFEEYRIIFDEGTEDQHCLFIEMHPKNKSCEFPWTKIYWEPSSCIDKNCITAKIVDCSVHQFQHFIRLAGIDKEIVL